MKKIIKTGAVLLLGAVIFPLLAACSSPLASELSSDALVTTVTVAGVNAYLGAPGTDWEETIRSRKVGHVYLTRSKLSGAEVVASVSSGSTVFYAQAKANVEPWFQRENVFDFDADDYLFIEVFSANHDAFNVYAIQVHCRNPGLSDIIFDGRSLYGGVSASGRPIAKYGDPGIPGNEWDNVEQEGEALFPESKAGDKARISFRPEVSYLKLWVAVASGDVEPNFSNGGVNNTSRGWNLENGGNDELYPSIIDGLYKPAVNTGGIWITLAADNFIYVKVQGDDESETTYYKLKMVGKSNNRAITNASFEIYDGTSLIDTYPVTIGQMGTESWSGGEAYGNYSNGAEIPGNTGNTQTVNPENDGILSLYLDSDMDTLKGWPGSDHDKDPHLGERPPANLRVVFRADFDGEMKFCRPRKNQRDAAEFNIESGDFGKLIGFWWWGVEVTSAMGEKGWYKFATRIGSQKADILESLTVNGVAVDFTGIKPAFASQHYDPDNDFGCATVILPADTNFGSTLQVVAKPRAGYYPLISAVMAPNNITNVPNISFNLNQDANFNPETGEFNGGLLLEPGNYIYVRVTAEISHYYGGSGFVSASWQPNRNLTDPVNRYTVQRFYKVRILKAGAQDGADLTDISNKGTKLNAPVANAKVTPTVTAGAITSTTDNKGNVVVGVTVTNKWDAQTGNDITLNDYSNPGFAAVLAPGSDKARVSFALRTSAAEANDAPVDSASFFAPAKFNAEALVQSNTWLVARIISESGKDANFYRFRLINNEGDATVPAGISVNNAAITGDLSAGLNAAANDANVIGVTLPNKAAFNSVVINVTKPHANTSVSIGLTNVNNAAPAEYVNATGTGTAASATFQSVPIAQFAVIRVISADKTKTVFYKLRLELAGASTATTISKINIAGVDIPDLPAANDTVTGTTFVTYNIPGDATVLNNLQVNVMAAAGSAVGYGSSNANNTAPSTYNDTGLFPIFPNGQWLIIRVIAEDNISAAYYKVRIVNGDNGTMLTDIQINGTSITSEPGVTIPDANAAVTGTTAALYHVAETDLANLTVTVTGDNGIKVAYAAAPANNTNTPAASFVASGTFAPFTDRQWLVIRVISGNDANTAYYKVRISTGSGSTALSGITVNGTPVSSVPAANALVTGTAAVTFDSGIKLTPVTVEATAAESGAGLAPDIAYAKAAANNANTAASEFASSGSLSGFTSGHYAVIRVVSSDTINTAYYKVQVIHGSADAELTAITVNGDTVSPLPPPNIDAAGTDAGEIELANGTLDTVTVEAAASDGNAAVSYAVAGTDSEVPGDSDYNTTGVFTDFTADQYIVIRVVSENLQTTNYYKVKVTEGS